MPWTAEHTQLRNALASLYDDQADARRVAQEAGINLNRINWDTNAVIFWQALLEESEKDSKTNAIVHIAQDEYPQNEELRAAAAAFTNRSHGQKDSPSHTDIAASEAPWNNQLSAKFHTCLLGAYNRSSLTHLLRFKFDKNLEAFVSSGNFSNEVFQLIEVARREDWIFELVAEAHEFNPGNKALAGFAARAAPLAGEQTATPFPTQAKDRLADLYRQFRNDDLFPEQCEAAVAVVQDIQTTLNHDTQLNSAASDMLLEQIQQLENDIREFKNQCRDHSTSSVEYREAINKLLEQIIEDIDHL